MNRNIFFIILSLIIMWSTNTSWTQNTDQITVFGTAPISKEEKGFMIKGDIAEKFLSEMFNQKPNTKRRGYIHKFRKITVKGILGTLTVQVNEGIFKLNGFNTFKNDKYKNDRIENMNEDEQLGVLVYIKKRKGGYITTDKETEAFCEYIKILSDQ